MKKKAIFIVCLVTILTLGYFTISYFLTPTNLTLLSSELDMTSYNKIESELEQTIDNTEVIIVNDNEEYIFTLTQLGYGLKDNYETKIRSYDNIINLNFSPQDLNNDLLTVDDEAMLETLATINEESSLQATDAQIVYEDKEFVIIPEIISDSVDLTLASEEIKSSIENNQFTIDVSNLKATPSITSEDLIDKQTELNNYINSSVIVNFDDEERKLSKSELYDLIIIDDEYNFEVNTAYADEFFTDITYDYDNVSYTTSKRKQETFYADDMEDVFYQEVEDKNTDISLDMRYDKQTTKLEQKKYAVKDTYVEVNISSQHMWFYKDGELIMHSPVVTGNVAEGYDTPTGTYTITEKLEDKTLNGASVGFDYSIPVDYWLRITDSGIGFHDGTWNTDEEFGSDKYLTNGSHGCINMPLDSVAKMYNNIEVGTTVYITE